MEREREHTQNGEDRIMKIQELVYNRPNLIRSQGQFQLLVVCFSFIYFFSSNMCVYSVQCRQRGKLNNANVHSSIIVQHEREKESSITMCVFSLVLTNVSIYIFVCICKFLYVYVFAMGCLFVSLSVCAGRDWGSVVCLCVEGAGCSPDFSWELQWSMSSAENGKSKPPAS